MYCARPSVFMNGDITTSSFLSVTASVHLPRIGHTTRGFNWYGTERLIRKHLAARGVPTYMYPSVTLTGVTVPSEAESSSALFPLFSSFSEEI